MLGTRESTQNRLNVAVLSCGTLGQEVAATLQHLEMVGRVVLFTTPYRTLKLGPLKSAKYTVRMEGWTALFRAVRRRVLRAKNVGEDERVPLTMDVPVEHHRFADFHDPDCLEAIAAFSPDLGVVAGTYILKEQVFSIPRLGCINLHSGKAPKYRGSMPAFWELFNGETEVGITIHRVISRLDAGEVLSQETFPLDPAPPGDVLKYLDRYQREVLRPNGVRMLVETVRSIGDGTITGWKQDDETARTYRLPTHREKMELRRRVAARRGGPCRAVMTAKAFVKHVAGRLLFTTGMYRKCLGSRAIVALFHRVDDRYPDDPISCTREAFVNYCEFFRRYFEVVSLSQLLESLDRKENVAGKLVITFDDGYYDNEATAAEVLSKRGLPACFFVATAFIESKLTPWWDERAGIKSQFMSWNQVRALRANGFEVGAHTENHVDLGRVDRETAEAEIAKSQLRLQLELGEQIVLFSYPFGRRDQMSETARSFVKKSGFRCCLSAFGGLVEHDCDPYHIPRVPIPPYYRSPYQFGFEVVRSK